MNKKYYLISYRIDLGSQTPHYDMDVIDTSPLEFVKYYKNLGGEYSKRSILFAMEISKEEYNDTKKSWEYP